MIKIGSIYHGIKFVHEPLIQNLVNTKCYINLETRPRGGRALLDAWMCKTPFISCLSTFYSQLFPEYSYSAQFNLNKILNIYKELKLQMEENYDRIIQEAEERAEPLYFDNQIKELMQRLYPNE
jgi:hypothetical protein